MFFLGSQCRCDFKIIICNSASLDFKPHVSVCLSVCRSVCLSLSRILRQTTSWRQKWSPSWRKWCMTRSCWPRRGKQPPTSSGTTTTTTTTIYYTNPTFGRIYDAAHISGLELLFFLTVCQDSNSGRSRWQSDHPRRRDTTGELMFSVEQLWRCRKQGSTVQTPKRFTKP